MLMAMEQIPQEEKTDKLDLRWTEYEVVGASR